MPYWWHMVYVTSLRTRLRGLRRIVMTRQNDPDMDKFPNDPIETALVIVTTIAVIAGIFALAYLARLNGVI